MTTRALASFPSAAAAAFDTAAYGFDVRQQVAAPSDYDGDVGIEIELEGRNLPPRIPFTHAGVSWVAHNDGSLRGGIEYVLSQPCAAADVDTLVTGLFDSIRTQGGVIVNSTRCSTHVHVNCRNMKLNQIAAFVTLYGSFETTLTNWCEPIRRGNLFALRFEDCHHAIDGWVRAFRTGDFEWPNENRYLALNPASLMRFGSLEVRTLGGVTSARPVVMWANALLRLRDLSCSDAYADPTTIAADISGVGGVGFTNRVFDGLDILPQLIEASGADSVENDVRAGFRRVQPIVYSVNWQHALPEIARVFIPNPFATARPRRTARRVAAPRLDAFPEPIFRDEDDDD